ncbi:MAG: dynamin family protein [Kiritimatiellaeota bacterium]|nr:dynamin family protein [Kiritimatiellota bacterium]
MFRKNPRDIETGVNRLYSAFKPTAERRRYAFRTTAITVGGKPNVILLGNHSSGKSTFINNLLGDPPVQNTGVAPTDDCFTVLLHGDSDRDFRGPAAIGQLPAEFAALEKLGPNFLQHLQVKFRDREYLRGTNLIDSPGMIDTAEGAAKRTYDFAAAVRGFVEISDLVYFLFDPEKPGTTGETVSVLSRCMVGLEFKLRVLLNKSDTFDSTYDFARAYGTLCWNLARVLRTKDLPTIYTTYTPQPNSRTGAKLDLTWFDKYRAEILTELNGAATRRYDSILANVRSDFTRLKIHAAVLNETAWALLLRRARLGAIVLLCAAAAFFVAYFFASPLGSFWRWLLICSTTVITSAAVAFFYARFAFRRFRASLLLNIDRLFETAFAEELATDTRNDLRDYWIALRDDTRNVIASKIRLPLFTWGVLRRIDSALERITEMVAQNRK